VPKKEDDGAGGSGRAEAREWEKEAQRKFKEREEKLKKEVVEMDVEL
jgi:hypothetical protein